MKVILDPPGDPGANMAKDERLAREVCEGAARATLRFYGWSRPAVSLGRRQQPGALPPELLRDTLPLVRRPTGGGAVIHTPEELTYSVAVARAFLPDGMPLNRVPGEIHRNLREILADRLGIERSQLQLAPEDSAGPYTLCFSAPVKGDLLFQGRKAAGSALRAWKGGVLVQGSVQELPVGREELIRALTDAVLRSFAEGEI